MSVQETTKIDEGVIAAWNAHDPEKFIAHFADEITWYDIGSPQPIHGKEGARQYFQSWMNAFPDMTVRIKERVATEDRVADELEFSGTNKGPLQGAPGTPAIPATGKKVNNVKGVYFAKVRNGKVTEVHTYPDNLGLMTQLGTLPPTMQKPM
jgi:steroid delta-isomerase-like uncharacterized protein